MKTRLILLLCLLLSSLQAKPNPQETPATQAKTAFVLGNEAFWQGKYANAITQYQIEIKKEPLIPEYHYNLALAHANQAQWGYAIYELEQAWFLDKNNDFKEGLIEARRKAIDFAMKNNPGQRMILADEDDIQTSFLDLLPALDLFSALIFSLSAIALLFAMKKPNHRALLRLGAFIVFLMSILLAILEWSKAQADQNQYAIVFEHQAKLQKGPGEQYEVEALLSAGLKCTIQGENQGWFRVVLSNGLEGWIPQKTIGVIGIF
jgi:hypothetical protein